MEQPTETDILRVFPGFWKNHNQHLTGTKLGPWCTVTDYDKKRSHLVDDYEKYRNSDAPPGDSEGILLRGKEAQPESIHAYLVLTGRIHPDLGFDVNNLSHASGFWPSDRLVFAGPLPLEGVNQLQDRSPGWEIRNVRWKYLLGLYGPDPWISVSPPGIVVAGGVRGALLVKTIFKQVDFSNMYGPHVDQLVHPTIDTWIQAILCLVCDPTINFVEIAMVNKYWVWTWRLQRDNAGLEAFKRAISPAAADWRQMQTAVAYPSVIANWEIDNIKQPLLGEVATNVRTQTVDYKVKNMRVRKVFEDDKGVIRYRWDKRDESGTCIDVVQNPDTRYYDPSFAERRRTASPFWVYAMGTHGKMMYVPTRTPMEAAANVQATQLMAHQPQDAFDEMAHVV